MLRKGATVMNTSAAVVVSLAFVFLAHESAHAQLFGPSPAPAPPPVSTECAHTFGHEEFAWCVSENGNLVALTSPAGAEHIRVGNVSEGYVVCAPDADSYYDVGTSSAGWEQAILVEAVGPSNVAIERTTTDGRFTLRQDVIGNSRERSITVVMTLTNLLGDATGVQILRHADVDVDNTFADDVFDKSADATWARQVHALTLTAVDGDVPHQTHISADPAPRTCTRAAVRQLPSQDSDLSVSVRYDVGDLAAGATRTVTFAYRVQ